MCTRDDGYPSGRDMSMLPFIINIECVLYTTTFIDSRERMKSMWTENVIALRGNNYLRDLRAPLLGAPEFT